jgi:hypothetical protein
MTSDAEGYEPPRVEDLPAEDGSVVAAAGVAKSPAPDDFGLEWRP